MLLLRQTTRRTLSHDEALQRYFHRLERDFIRTLERGRVRQVIQRKDGVDYVLQIEAVRDSGDGLVVIVR